MIRNLFAKLQQHIKKKEFSIITGARQMGKSTLMRQLDEYCQKMNTPTVFLNLENRAVLNDLNQSPLNLLSYLPETENRIVVFVDEVQYLSDPSNFLKLLYDEYAHKIKIVATGSSAFYLDKSFNDSLAGRKRIFWLLPCAFDEYLALRKKENLLKEVIEIRKNKHYKTLEIELLRQEWEAFMLFGGYPAVITETVREEKIARLAEIRDSFLKRDILEAGVQNEAAFYSLFRLLASQSGNLLNTNELSATLRIKNETVSHYLEILQKCFHITLVKPFFQNLRKELTKMPKGYLHDNGMRNSLLNNFQPVSERIDKGMIWENTVFEHLCQKYNTDEIHFWRTSDDNEVDFVLPNIETPQAIECKYDATRISLSKYKKFIENYPNIPLSFSSFLPFDNDFFRKL
ncbi:MAG: ATP-binding protein [Prevotellaceae bacterium]|jgi:predicted AAA+ superfamily ATPase|nr:ATP-binding protein [Prevotellaceae bacterium]